MKLYKDIADFIIGLAKEKGAETAYCVVNDIEMREFNVDGNEFSLFRTLFSRSVSITVFVDKRKGSVSLNKFDRDEIAKAVDSCIESAKSASPDDAWEIAPFIGKKEFESGALTPDTDKLFFRTKELLEDIKSRHPSVITEQMIVYHSSGKSLYMSSTGNEYYSNHGLYSVDLMYSAHRGEKSTSFFGSSVAVDNLDKPFIECAMIEKELCDIENQIDTTPTEGKFEGTVIFAPNCVAGDIIGNICGNFAGDTALLEGTSIWKDKLGQQVADKRINIAFNPKDKRIVTGQKYTSEGFLAEDFDFIKDGVLQCFAISQYVANKTNNKRALNTSSSLIIEGGETSLEDMIKKVKKGVLVGRFSGGSPGANGEFSGVAKNGFMIENGKITSAISETMISGNLADMLFNLVDISKETLIDGNMVVPYMAFDGITISGK